MTEDKKNLLKNTDKIRTRCFEIWVENEILYVEGFEGVEVELEDVKKAFEIYDQLGFGPGKKRGLQIMVGRKYYSLTKEAKEYAAHKGRSFFIASAIISELVALRLAVNVFNSLYKPKIPFKMFASEEKALEWLRKYALKTKSPQFLEGFSK